VNELNKDDDMSLRLSQKDEAHEYRHRDSGREKLDLGRADTGGFKL